MVGIIYSFMIGIGIKLTVFPFRRLVHFLNKSFALSKNFDLTNMRILSKIRGFWPFQTRILSKIFSSFLERKGVKLSL